MAKAAARHILVSTEAKANELKTAIENGADFAQVAKENSSCPSSRDGGNLGTFGRGEMVKEFDAVVFSAPVGEVQGPVKTQFGYHLVEVTSRQDERPAATAKRRQERSWRRFALRRTYCRAWNSAGSNGSRCSSTASAPTMSAYMPCANSASTWASSVARSGLAAGSSPPPNTPCRPRRCSGTPPSPAARAPDPATRHRRARPRSGGRGSWPSWAGS